MRSEGWEAFAKRMWIERTRQREQPTQRPTSERTWPVVQ